MQKKILDLLSVFFVSVILVACGDSTSGSDNKNENSNYPEKPIELVIPYSSGGQTDIAARILAEYLQDNLDNDVKVVNQEGSGGAVAINEVVTANPDGYKILLHHDAMHVSNVMDQINESYKDLTPIDASAEVEQTFVVSADSPWESLDDFVKDAKENSDEYIFAADIGATTHFMGEMLAQEADIDLKMQDTGDESERMSSLLGGHSDIAATSLGNAIDYEESGDFKILAVLSEDLGDEYSDLKTAKEQGYDVVFPVRNVLYGPSDLPEEVIDVWDDVTKKIVEDDNYQEEIGDADFVHPEDLTSEETMEFVEERYNLMDDIAENIEN